MNQSTGSLGRGERSAARFFVLLLHRNVIGNRIDALAEDIAKRIYNSMEQEVSSKQIGEMVMEGLQKLDEVAYVRYASVYRSFKDISAFLSELEEMVGSKKSK